MMVIAMIVIFKDLYGDIHDERTCPFFYEKARDP